MLYTYCRSEPISPISIPITPIRNSGRFHGKSLFEHLRTLLKSTEKPWCLTDRRGYRREFCGIYVQNRRSPVLLKVSIWKAFGHHFGCLWGSFSSNLDPSGTLWDRRGCQSGFLMDLGCIWDPLGAALGAYFEGLELPTIW